VGFGEGRSGEVENFLAFIVMDGRANDFYEGLE
jgi:hypothetical protein